MSSDKLYLKSTFKEIIHRMTLGVFEINTNKNVVKTDKEAVAHSCRGYVVLDQYILGRIN